MVAVNGHIDGSTCTNAVDYAARDRAAPRVGEWARGALLELEYQGIFAASVIESPRALPALS